MIPRVEARRSRNEEPQRRRAVNGRKSCLQSGIKRGNQTSMLRRTRKIEKVSREIPNFGRKRGLLGPRIHFNYLCVYVTRKERTAQFLWEKRCQFTNLREQFECDLNLPRSTC